MQEVTDLKSHRVEHRKKNAQRHSGTVRTVRPESMSSGRDAQTTHHVHGKHCSTQYASSDTNNSRDGGIVRHNSANYAQQYLGLCAEILPIMCAIFSAVCYIFCLFKN